MSTESTPAATHDGDVDDVSATLAARRAPRISQADVFRAADELLVQGDRPTIDRVRMRLGRGSPNTINDHLDTWWAHLGARLRDLPGHEFPQLPERVAQNLQRLWNDALESAHEVLQGTLLAREQAIAQREQALQSQTQQLTEREHAGAARAAALEGSLALAREQLSVANRRGDTLVAALQEREVEGVQQQAVAVRLQATVDEAREELRAITLVHQRERAQLREDSAAAEARWLQEVDRARQAIKEREQQVKELRTQISRLQSLYDKHKDELLQTRAELKTVVAVREQLEMQVRAQMSPVKNRDRVKSNIKTPLQKRPSRTA